MNKTLLCMVALLFGASSALALPPGGPPGGLTDGPLGQRQDGPPGPRPAPDPEARVVILAEELGLTGEQADALSAILQEAHAMRQEIQEAFRASTTSQRETMRVSMCALRAEIDAQLAALLTDDQYEQLKELIEPRRRGSGGPGGLGGNVQHPGCGDDDEG